MSRQHPFPLEPLRLVSGPFQCLIQKSEKEPQLFVKKRQQLRHRDNDSHLQNGLIIFAFEIVNLQVLFPLSFLGAKQKQSPKVVS